MLPLFDSLRSVTMAAVTVRLLLAAVCGSAIGIEREYKRRSAGFRTHILICLGAAMTTMTSQYLFLIRGYYTDVARLGAQVVAGVGFIGAGTIMVTHRRRVKGLTTAAGLWASAIVGLALGAGFYEGGLLATVLILLTELFLSRIEHRMLERAPEINLYVTYADRSCLERMLQFFRSHDILLLDMELMREKDSDGTCALFSLRVRPPYNRALLLREIQDIGGILQLDEL